MAETITVYIYHWGHGTKKITVPKNSTAEETLIKADEWIKKDGFVRSIRLVNDIENSYLLKPDDKLTEDSHISLRTYTDHK